jgi:hypothetical protein
MFFAFAELLDFDATRFLIVLNRLVAVRVDCDVCVRFLRKLQR